MMVVIMNNGMIFVDDKFFVDQIQYAMIIVIGSHWLLGC